MTPRLNVHGPRHLMLSFSIVLIRERSAARWQASDVILLCTASCLVLLKVLLGQDVAGCLRLWSRGIKETQQYAAHAFDLSLPLLPIILCNSKINQPIILSIIFAHILQWIINHSRSSPSPSQPTQLPTTPMKLLLLPYLASVAPKVVSDFMTFYWSTTLDSACVFDGIMSIYNRLEFAPSWISFWEEEEDDDDEELDGFVSLIALSR